MATADRNDPYRAFNFKVEFDGLTPVAFSECSGLTADVEAAEYREGTDKALTVRKLNGLAKYTNITLKRGYTLDTSVWDWFLQASNGNAERRNGLITLIDEEGNEVLRWAVESAWPTKIEGPSFNATGNEVAIESLEVVHEGLAIDS